MILRTCRNSFNAIYRLGCDDIFRAMEFSGRRLPTLWYRVEWLLDDHHSDFGCQWRSCCNGRIHYFYRACIWFGNPANIVERFWHQVFVLQSQLRSSAQFAHISSNMSRESDMQAVVSIHRLEFTPQKGPV